MAFGGFPHTFHDGRRKRKHLALKDMEGDEEERVCGKWRVACCLNSYNLRDVFTCSELSVPGQCQGGDAHAAELPELRPAAACDRNLLQILKTKWWKYLLMGLADVEANYAVVKAYQFTTLTSIQLLDCFVIPVLMVLSWFFLKTRYRLVHFVAVTVCLLGVGAMVGADILAGRDQGSTSHVVLGDGLVLLSAGLYAVSNMCQEHTVKNLSRVEFLGMMGLFGTLISGIQLAVLETCAVAAIEWNFHISMLFAVYALCMYALYSFMPVVFSTLYIISFVVITVGFVMFNALPTYSALPESSSSEDDPAEVFADRTAESPSDRLLSAGRDSQGAETLTAVAAL
ncbi:hypothetical protein FQN60_000412 [Etheostoma spectabile]|uniref:Solute carrier family 35 member F2 n=1 Tax=Etheostoma spectabile TaxID=54343 RepID=A0A5J5D1G6_9PERO|nr:hypothetical protein FQN60_000412 [Etheostoma spectabile]